MCCAIRQRRDPINIIKIKITLKEDFVMRPISLSARRPWDFYERENFEEKSTLVYMGCEEETAKFIPSTLFEK